jgi:uncharacterized sulfatase
MRAAHEKWALETRDLGLIPEPEIATREQTPGTRYAILRQPESEQYIRKLRALVEAVNRDANATLVRRSLDDPDPAVRYWAVVGLTRSGASAEASRDRVVKAMGDAAPVVRIAAARAASKYLDHEGAVPLLIRELASDQEWVRLHAAIALDEIGPKARPAKAALEQAKDDQRNNYVQRVAEHALAQLGA